MAPKSAGSGNKHTPTSKTPSYQQILASATDIHYQLRDLAEHGRKAKAQALLGVLD